MYVHINCFLVDILTEIWFEMYLLDQEWKVLIHTVIAHSNETFPCVPSRFFVFLVIWVVDNSICVSNYDLEMGHFRYKLIQPVQLFIFVFEIIRK